MNVPLLDLKAEYATLKTEILESISRVLDGMQLYEGENVAALEAELAAYCGSRHAVGVGSGTEALLLTLLACGIGPGDEVITVSHTFIATVATIAFAGARPVFVDIDPRTCTLDVSRLEAALTPRTKAILPVHLYGLPADMDPILELARSRGLKVIEDASQAHGAEYKGKKVGTLGDAGCFSFVYTKILNAYGDAGIVTTSDDELAQKIRLLRDHGRSGKNVHSVLGLNCRLDEIHAATLRIKLRHLDHRLARRREIAALYEEGLGSSGVTTPWQPEGVRSAWWQYVIRSERRDDLAAWLKSRGIASGIHYPIPCHKQEACREFAGPARSLPETERCVAEILSLPIYPELEADQIRAVIAAVQEYGAQEGRA
jgi:dTDP-4-amino-4,6-dideoxygalactose transaminase